MAYTVDMNSKLLAQFTNLPKAYQIGISEFMTLYKKVGLTYIHKNYPGKLSYSWDTTDPQKYKYAKDNDLWHYHLGLPTYNYSSANGYSTSDVVLHFQWPNCGDHISIVDVYDHNTSNNNFYLPHPDYLLK